jgi:hypothetical protein
MSGKKNLQNKPQEIIQLMLACSFFDNLDDEINFAPLPHKMDKLVRCVRG